jgi:hypothetical protein
MSIGATGFEPATQCSQISGYFETLNGANRCRNRFRLRVSRLVRAKIAVFPYICMNALGLMWLSEFAMTSPG